MSTCWKYIYLEIKLLIFEFCLERRNQNETHIADFIYCNGGTLSLFVAFPASAADLLQGNYTIKQQRLINGYIKSHKSQKRNQKMVETVLWVLIAGIALAIIVHSVAFVLKILWYIFAGFVLIAAAIVIGLRFAIHQSKKSIFAIKEKINV